MTELNEMSVSNNKTTEKRPRKYRRLIRLVVIGCLLAGGGLFFKYYWLEHPAGSGPAGPTVSQDAFEKKWTDRKVLLVGLGDSITAGMGASPSSKSYFNRLLKPPNDEFSNMRGICLSTVIPNLTAENLARSGSTSIENLKYAIPKLEVHDAGTFGIVVMTTGGNDIIHDYGRGSPHEGAMYGASLRQAQPWIRGFRKRLRTTFDRIESSFPGGCCIFMGNIYDPTDGVGNAVTAGLPRWPDALNVIREYNEVIAECARERDHVHLVNIHDAFLGHGIYSRQFWNEHYRSRDPHYWYWVNFEDPNNRGYDAIRRLFLIEMAKTLPQALKADAK